MIFLIVIVFVTLLAVAPHLLGPAYRRRRAAAELRGDWWTDFERDLRQYTSQTWRSAREAERRL